MKTNFDELREKYLKSKGLLCPFCDSNDLACGNASFDGPEGFQDVKCNSCDNSWTDSLALTSVTFEQETI